MSTQHTPELWHIEGGDGQGRIFVAAETKRGKIKIADVVYTPDGGYALLIAAAPKMKIVLEKLAEWQAKYPPGRIYHYDEAPTIEAALTKIINEGIEVLQKAKGQ